MFLMKRNWKEYNEKLIRRGEIYLDEGVLKNTEKELRKMNKRKEGHHYQYPNSYLKNFFSFSSSAAIPGNILPHKNSIKAFPDKLI